MPPRPAPRLVHTRCARTKSRPDLHRTRVIHSFHRCYDSHEPLTGSILGEHPLRAPTWGQPPRPPHRSPRTTTSRFPHRASPQRAAAWQDAQSRTPYRIPQNSKDPHREVPRRPRRARRCRRLGCPQPPGPPERSGPLRTAHRCERRGPGALDLRLRDVRPGDPAGRGVRRGPRPGQRPAARRHLPQPAGQAGRDGARRPARLADLRLGPVQPADDAGRGLPDAPGHAHRDRHRAERRRSRTPSPRRSPPPAATTCCRC